MTRRFVLLVTMVAITALIAGCMQAAPASPTQAPKAADPTKAPTAQAAATAAPAPAQPTAAPAPKVTFPEKGKSINWIIPYPAGGGSDIATRVTAPYFEKAIGVPVNIVNKGGAGSQVGVTDAVKAKPDGYTIGHANWPTIITLYLDPDRKAAFTRKDFQPVAMHVTDPLGVAVKADSPYKSIKDLVDAAKAKPGEIKVGTGGLMSPEDFSWRQLQKMTGVKFSIVTFDGGAPGNTALLGGHIDAFATGISSQLGPARSGQTRLIATMTPEGRNLLPGLTTMEDQGYKGFFGLGRGWFVPAGTPKDVVDALAKAFEVAENNDENNARLKEQGQFSKFMGPDEFGKYWDDMEKFVAPLVDEARQANK